MAPIRMSVALLLVLQLAPGCGEKSSSDKDVPAAPDGTAEMTGDLFAGDTASEDQRGRGDAAGDAALADQVADDSTAGPDAEPPDGTVPKPDGVVPPDGQVAPDGALVPETAAEASVPLEDLLVAPDLLEPDGSVTQEDLAAGEDAAADAGLEDLAVGPDAGQADTVTPPDVPEVPPEEMQKPWVLLSTHVIRKAIYEEHLVVQCRTVNGYGEQIPDPGVYEISTTAPDAIKDEAGHLFPTPGTYTVSCTDAGNDLVGKAELVVAHEAAAPGLSTASAALGRQAERLEQAIAAAQADDLVLLQDALDGLHEDSVQITSLPPAIALVPPGGWPSLAELKAKVPADPDDGGYIAAVAAVAAEAAAVVVAVETMQTAPSLQAFQAIGDATQSLSAALGEVKKLEPGAVGLYEAMPAWEEAMAALQEGQAEQVLLLTDMFENPEAWEVIPCPGCFTLTELMVNVAISAILDSIPTYNGLLVEAGKAAASMALMMMLADAIDAAFPAGPDSPAIEYLMPGYGNAVNDGAQLSFFGQGFDYWPGNNAVIFIGPQVADAAINVVSLVMDAMDAIEALGEWSNVWELSNALWDSFNVMKDSLGLLSEDIPDLMSKGVVALPVGAVESLGLENWYEQIVYLAAPLPEVNDSWLPKAGILIPISFTRGNGASYKIVILP
jgi:hypothetical protein